MKKKKLFLIPLAMFMAAGTVSLAGCGDEKEEQQQQPDDPVVAKLSSIAVKTPPTKLAYVAGESFETAGLEIEATYSDGSKKTVNGWTVDKTVLALGDSKVVVSYTEGGETKTVDIAITVDPVTPPPVEKVLTEIVVGTQPTKTTYVEGEDFNPEGMSIVAKYSDESEATIPGTEYTISPLHGLAIGTDHVTITYEEGGVEKTVDVAITVTEAEDLTNYGTEDSPLSVTEAAAILTSQCVNDKDLTKQAITAVGQVKAIRNVYHYDGDIGPDCFELDLSDGESDIYLYRLHATAEVGANIEVNSTVKFKGFGKNFKGTLEIVDNGDVKCTALSAEKSSKVAVSLTDIVGPTEVALNSQVSLSDVTFTVVYDDDSTLEGQHPDSIDLVTSTAGEKTATIHYGDLTGTFSITVKEQESPNQFVDAYNAAVALENKTESADAYNFKGVVVAKRNTEYYVQYEGYGLDVYNPSTKPAVGDFVEVNATVKKYNGTLETGTINSLTVLENEQSLPEPVAITSEEVLANTKQNVLSSVSGIAKADVTGAASSDKSIELTVGEDTITIFFKGNVVGKFAEKLNSIKAGDPVTLSGGVTGAFNANLQVLACDDSVLTVSHLISGVEFEEESYSVLVGETVTVKASVLPANADDTEVVYSLANASEGVEATIDAETGEITAGSVAGTVEVVATAHGDSTKTASVLLTISSAAIPVTGVSLDKEDMTIEMKGEGPWTGSLTATVAPSDATNKNYSFSSDDESVATVTAEGVVTGLKEGKCDITVTTEDGAKTAVCHVSVIPEQPIVKEGTYTIKHVKSGTAYYMVDPNASSSPTASTNLADAAVFDFILQEGTLNQYKIKIHGENKYLYVTKSNSGLRIGNTEAVWTIANGSQATGAFDMSCSDGENTRYLTLFNTQDFRCYTNNTTNRTENTDLEAVVAKDVESIAIKQNPTKMSYYVGEAFDPTGMIVTVTFTDKTTEDITEGFTYEGSTGFQAANPDRTVKVTYKTKNAYVQHVEVKEDDRTITAIKFAEGCDMTKKEYEVGDDWDPKGLKVIAVRSDDSEFELADSDVTFTYDKTTEAAAESMTLNVTAHYVVDDSTTLDSAAKAITVVVKAKEEVEGSLYTFDPAKKTTTAIDGTKFMQALVLEDGDEIITGASNVSNTYIGASGGSGGTAWALESCLKLGKGSGGYGSVTLALDSTISFTKVKVCVLGWADTCKLKVGDIEKEFSNKAAKDNLTPVELEFNISSGESSLTIQSVYSSGNLAVLVTSIQFC